MTKNQKSDRAKLALIPVLSLVLVFVLMGDDSGSSNAPPARTPRSTNAESTTPRSPEIASVETSAAVKATWPRQSLSAIVQHNPLELRDPRVEVARAFEAAGITLPFTANLATEYEFFPERDPASRLASRFVGVRYLFDLNKVVNEVARTVEPVVAAAAESKAAAPDSMELGAADRPVAQGAGGASTPNDSGSTVDATALRMKLDALRSQPVRMFMKSSRGNSALLGERRIVEGQLLEEGIFVAEITREGVTFEIVTGTERTSENPAVATPQAAAPRPTNTKL